MNKGELISTVAAEFPDTPKKRIKEFFEVTSDAIIQGLKDDGKVVFGSLGSFNVKQRKARKGRNPQTGETINIKAKTVVKYRVSKFLKEEVL